MGDLLRDLKYSVRMLFKSPLFSFVAIVTLALGIGLNAATFSVVHTLLVETLPGAHEPDRLVQVYRAWPGMDYGSNSIPHYQDVRDRSGEVFESVAAWTFAPVSISAEGRSERIMGVLASANFFDTYGVVPEVGRGFIAGVESEGPGEHPVTVLGYSFWQSRFGGDEGVVGRTLQVNGQPFEVVGIVPEGFRGPMSMMDVPLYFPLMMQPQLNPVRNLIERRGSNSFFSDARLRDGKTVEQAEQMMEAMHVALREELPDQYNENSSFTLVPQNEAGIHPMFKDAQVGMSAVIMTVVALLLMIACVNVANLFLARARERRQEMGVRISLGGGRLRIVRQLLTESMVFSALGGLAGVGLAYLSGYLLQRVQLPVDGPFAFNFEVDRTVLLFTLGVSVLAGLLFGLVPALQASSPQLVQAIRDGAGGGWSRSRLSRGLIVLQVALSLVLLITSGLFLRALEGATRIDPGFDEPASLAMASVDPGLQGYAPERTHEFFDRLQENLERQPGIQSVGLANSLPLGLGGSDTSVTVPGYEFAEGELRSLRYAYVREGFLETMGIELLEGRTFTRQDDATAAPGIIVNQRFAQRFWPGESALGKVVNTIGQQRTVLGVVETGKVQSLGEEPTEYMYFPQRELFASAMTVVVRTGGSAEAALQALRQTVRELDADMPVYDVRTMQDHLGLALLPARLAGTVLGAFGILGLLLAAVGIYGVMAYSVSQRQKELGIRVALGADQPNVVQMVVADGLRLTAIGVALGLAGAAAASRLVAGMLYDVSALDPIAFGLVPLILVGVAFLAVYVPARRASKVDPIRVLKVA